MLSSDRDGVRQGPGGRDGSAGRSGLVGRNGWRVGPSRKSPRTRSAAGSARSPVAKSPAGVSGDVLLAPVAKSPRTPRRWRYSHGEIMSRMPGSRGDVHHRRRPFGAVLLFGGCIGMFPVGCDVGHSIVHQYDITLMVVAKGPWQRPDWGYGCARDVPDRPGRQPQRRIRLLAFRLLSALMVWWSGRGRTADLQLLNGKRNGHVLRSCGA
jgi:hypothetical protein